jgi:PKD repeat protein
VLNAEGVVAWGRGNTVNFTVYDPTRNGWQTRSVSISNPTFDLQDADGIVAWSANSPLNTQVYRFEYYVYDPSSGTWVGGNVPNSAFSANLSIRDSVVSWTAIGDISYNRGYNPNTRAWETSPLPLAWFAVSTNAGNAPFSVSFIDMSIGGSTWAWNFGDGLGSSIRRSPIYRYTTLGRFNATLTVGGSAASRTILTDTIPPSGTNRINNGASFTTNPVVTLTLSATDNSGVVAGMRFSNDGVTWSEWEPFASSKTWMLSAGNGNKTVSAQFRDSASNTSANANASIQLDTTPPPRISLVNTNVDEGAGVATVLVALDHAYFQSVSVRFGTSDGTATDPTDYLSTNGLLTFPANTMTRSISIPILNDGQVELNETVHVVFSDATNGVAGPLGTITILDDDPATVTFASTNFNAIEGSGEAVITVVLNAASGLPVSVHYSATNGVATPGVDFEPVEGLLVFAPGQTSRTFTVPLINESLDEFSETIELKLFNATNAFIGAPFQAALTILDDDNPVVFFGQGTFPVEEDEGVAVVQVWLSKPFNRQVEVECTAFGGTATPGFPGDYFAASGRLVFTVNTTNQLFFVNLVNDHEPEPVETIRVTLNTNTIVNASAGPRIAADIVITDDDGPPLLVAPTVTASRQFQVTFQGKSGQRFSVEASTNLPIWFPVATLTNLTGALPYTDPTPATGPRRFYRSSVTP